MSKNALERVKNTASRTCLEAFGSSPASSTHAEAGEFRLNCDANYVYNASLNFDQSPATELKLFADDIKLYLSVDVDVLIVLNSSSL